MEQLTNYGVLGIVVIALAGYIMFLHKMHKKDVEKRDELLQKFNDKMDARQDQTNEAIKENTSILSALKTLLEHKK